MFIPGFTSIKSKPSVKKKTDKCIVDILYQFIACVATGTAKNNVIKIINQPKLK